MNTKETRSAPEGKFSSADRVRQDRAIQALREEFPNANIRQDEEYFIYDVVNSHGEPVQIHTPKWEHIPVKGIGPVAVDEVIRAELKYRSRFTNEDYSLAAALKMLRNKG